MAWCLATLSSLLWAGCGPTAPLRPVYISPLALHGARPLPPIQTLQVVALLDTSYQRLPNARRRAGERLDALADHLAARFGLDLQLRDIRPWSHTTDTLDGGLSALASSSQAPTADLVVAFTGQRPPTGAHLNDHARGPYGGRFIIARALEGTGERLHDDEVRALLSAVGTLFGALPVCAPALLALDPAPDQPASWRWHPTNLALVRTHAILRPGARIPADIARRAHDILERAPPEIMACGGGAGPRRLDTLAHLAAPAPQKKSGDDAPAQAPITDDVAYAAGLLALEAGDAAKALVLCEPIAAADPAHAAARCTAKAAEALRRPALAIRYLRASLAMHPLADDLRLRLARLVGRQGDDASARALLRHYVERHPDDHTARVNLGVACARLGDIANARRHWRHALKLRSDDVALRRLLRRLPRDPPTSR